MIQSARPIGHASSEHCFLLFCFSRFEKWGRMYVRTYGQHVRKTMIPTGRDFGLAEWINTQSHMVNLNFLYATKEVINIENKLFTSTTRWSFNNNFRAVPALFVFDTEHLTKITLFLLSGGRNSVTSSHAFVVNQAITWVFFQRTIWVTLYEFYWRSSCSSSSSRSCCCCACRA